MTNILKKQFEKTRDILAILSGQVSFKRRDTSSLCDDPGFINYSEFVKKPGFKDTLEKIEASHITDDGRVVVDPNYKIK